MQKRYLIDYIFLGGAEVILANSLLNIKSLKSKFINKKYFLLPNYIKSNTKGSIKNRKSDVINMWDKLPANGCQQTASKWLAANCQQMAARKTASKRLPANGCQQTASKWDRCDATWHDATRHDTTRHDATRVGQQDKHISNGGKKQKYVRASINNICSGNVLKIYGRGTPEVLLKSAQQAICQA